MRAEPEILNCPQCGTRFLTHCHGPGIAKKFCSEPCNRRAQAAKWRKRNPAKTRPQAIRNAAIIAAVKKRGCTECGETHPRCLDFHHVRGQKKYNVSQFARCAMSEASLRAEISKCVVLCANCHRKAHAKGAA